MQQPQTGPDPHTSASSAPGGNAGAPHDPPSNRGTNRQDEFAIRHPMLTLWKRAVLGKHRQRVLVVGMAASLFIGVALVFSLFSWRNVVERHGQQLEIQAVMGAQAVDTYLVMMEKAFEGLGRQLLAEGVGPATGTVLAEFRQRYPEFEAVNVQRLNGEVIASTAPIPAGEPPSVAAEPSFILGMQALEEGAAMSVSRPFKAPLRKLWVAPLRYGVRDTQGRLLYTLSAGLSVERAHAFWKDARLPPDAGMGLLRNDDLFVIARHPRVESMTDDKLYSQPAPGVIGDYLRRNGLQASGTVRAKSAVTGYNTVVSFQRLAHYPVTFFVADSEKNLVPVWWSFAWPVYVLLLALFGGGAALLSAIARRQREWRAERERRLAVLEAQAEKERQINARLDALSREQIAGNEQLTELTRRLSRSNARLEEANAELEAFMYSVSHDLRAPIRAIDSYAALLGETLSEIDIEAAGTAGAAAGASTAARSIAPQAAAGATETAGVARTTGTLEAAGAAPPAGTASPNVAIEAGELVGRIRASSRRMADLLNDLLDLSRYSTKALEQSPIDMRAEVAAVLAELGADASNRMCRARIDIDPLPACRGDPLLVRQIWLNLIANALKFSAPREAPVIHIGFANGAYFVADNGAGFDMAYADKLFKLFSRLHDGRAFEGTGIGLAIVKRVTERMGGRVGAQSVPEMGARFHFSLPG